MLLFHRLCWRVVVLLQWSMPARALVAVQAQVAASRMQQQVVRGTTRVVQQPSRSRSPLLHPHSVSAVVDGCQPSGSQSCHYAVVCSGAQQ